MITQIQHLEKKKFYLSSTGYTGILEEFPVPLLGFVRDISRENHQQFNILGRGKTKEYIQVSDKDYDALKQFRGKIWSVPEQVSFFLPEDVYQTWMKPLREVKYLYFDIEVGTSKGRIPDWNRDPIIMIGAAINDGEIMIFDEGDELGTIMSFLQFVREQDPDVVVGYFSKGFDLPYIMGRLLVLEKEFPSYMHRISIPDRFFRQPNGYIDPDGRITSVAYEALGFGRTNYDIFESSVKLDTSIHTKNKRMKTVGQYFKLPEIFDIAEEDKTDMLVMYKQDREKLHQYLRSDIRLTRNLSKIYIPRTEALVKMARTSLDFILNSKGRAVFARTFVAKSFIDNKVYPVLKNSIRNSAVFRDINGGYQGAFTAIRHIGRFSNTSKVDFSSMYPSIMLSFNISPDTVEYRGKSALTLPEDPSKINNMLGQGAMKDNYYPILIEESNQIYLDLAVPDEQAGGYIHARIYKDRKGVIPNQLDQLFKMRADIRKKMKSLDKTSMDYITLDSEQLGIKIAMNSIYGLSGNEHLEVGDITCAILITAFGREISHFCTAEIGDRAIEIDTDGVYINGDIDVDYMNDLLKKAILEKFPGFPFEPRLSLELEKKGLDSLFIGMKNYVLRNPATGEVYVTGSSMKGSGKSAFVESVLTATATHLLNGMSTDDVYAKVLEMIAEERPDEDYRIAMAIHKDLDEYESDGGIFAKMESLRERAENEKLSIVQVKAILESSLQKELKRYEKSRIRKKMEPLKEGYAAEVIAAWRGDVQGMKTSDAIIKNTEAFMARFLGDQSRAASSMNYRLYERAIKSGTQILKGDSIEYYYALSENKEEMFTAANLSRYPIDKMRYIKHVEATVKKMLQSVESQSVGTLF